MSNAPNSESFAELVRMPKASDAAGRSNMARKMIVALARESGVLGESLDNYEGAKVIAELFAPLQVVAQASTDPVHAPFLPSALPTYPRREPVREITDRFGVRAMDETQQLRVVGIRATFRAVEQVLTHAVAPGRYLSLCFTALEEACMYAVKGVSHENG
jgi:hypothetical protein